MNERLEQLFGEAMDHATRERAAFLAKACAGDVALRAEVESLLAESALADQMIGGAIGRMAESFAPSPGQRVGPYRLVKPIGSGGMGFVFLAERADGQFEQQVAIKFVRGGATVTSRFLRERQILAHLVHPNIARLIDGGFTEDGVPYMAMEYFPGLPITEYCRTRNLDRKSKLLLFQRVCQAVEHAHRNLIIHRDLKPSNILVGEDGSVKLLDFGIAKLQHQDRDDALTIRGMYFFTPEYASPEQVRGDTMTTATDVYSLGAVLFELFGGESPHRLQNTTPGEIARVVCEVPAPPLSAGDDLDEIVQMALRKEPERRYASVSQFADDVERLIGNRPVIARADSARYRFTKFVRRNAWAIGAGCVAAVSLIAGLGVATWQAQVARAEAQEAQKRFQQVRKLARTVVFDLDPKIREVEGATEARELLAKTALEYLDSLYSDAQHDVGLRKELALAYEKIADVQGEQGRPNLGQTQNATRNYERAIELWDSIPEPQRDLAALARTLMKRGVRKSLDRAIPLAEKVHAAAPNAEESLELLGHVWRQSAANYDSQNLFAPAKEHYAKALAVLRTRAEKYPGRAADQAAAELFTDYAYAVARSGDPHAALALLDQLPPIHARLLAGPWNAQTARQIYMFHQIRGHVLGNPRFYNLGRTEEAVASFQRAVAVAERRLREDPRNALAMAAVASANLCLGLTLARTQPAQAKVAMHKAVELTLRLQERSPKTLGLMQEVARARSELGRVHVQLGEYDAARTHLEEAVRLTRIVAQARPRPNVQMGMIAPLTHLLRTEAEMGRLTKAGELSRELIEVLPAMDKVDRIQLGIKADAYAALGRFSALRGNGDAAEWYRQAIAVFAEMERAGATPAYLEVRRDPILHEFARWKASRSADTQQAALR
jgi:tetratricopeptide (TPR) repeat protein